MSNYGNRGKQLERFIDKQIQTIQRMGFHGHKNHPQRTFEGKFIKGEPFDYEIFTDKRKLCFDAKESKTDRWSVSNAKLSQINALKQCKNAGMEAFFLVYFYPSKKLVRFDVDLLIDSEKKFLTESEGTEFDFRSLL